jgi:hypothetical protein
MLIVNAGLIFEFSSTTQQVAYDYACFAVRVTG